MGRFAGVIVGLIVLGVALALLVSMFESISDSWARSKRERAEKLKIRNREREDRLRLRAEAEQAAHDKAEQERAEVEQQDWLAELAAYRRDNPVRVEYDPPEIEEIRSATNRFLRFQKLADGAVPPFIRSYPYEAGDPERWRMRADCLTIPAGDSIQRVYNAVDEAMSLPFILVDGEETTVSLPTSAGVRIVWADNGETADLSSDTLTTAYAADIESAERLTSKRTDALRLMHSAALKSADALSKLLLLRNQVASYRAHEADGIAKHFALALELLPLPLPNGYSWTTFYDAPEKTLQVNQRVVLPTLIDFFRPDSKRPLTKRDDDFLRRRVVLVIAMHIAQFVAISDLNKDVATIAVNCWARYFDKRTGKSNDAFVCSLTVAPNEILSVDIDRADAVEAFRGLKGLFAYSVDEVVPIEPTIRLDRHDARFVEGRDVLSGLLQGQNLASMDWQDFEHLIREVFTKEYSGNGGEVKITRASRDQGVDAVVFDPDPLRGGKTIIQAKRYNAVVEVSAARDLWGTVISENAIRGILVTTSWFGRDAKEWCADKRITLIDGQNLLALLRKHGYDFTIRTGE